MCAVQAAGDNAVVSFVNATSAELRFEIKEVNYLRVLVIITSTL